MARALSQTGKRWRWREVERLGAGVFPQEEKAAAE